MKHAGRVGENVQEWLDRLVREWPEGVPFDARAILAELPEYDESVSIVLDLAYEEFCQARERGESAALSEFVARFPEVESSLRELLRWDEDLHRTDPVDWPAPGERLLEFELLRELGRGERSRVFLAHERVLGHRTVVVKVCVGGNFEASLLGQLVHPHVVPVHSVASVPETLLSTICMPYAGEVTLHEAVRRAFDDAPGPERRPTDCRAIAARLREVDATTGRKASEPASLPDDYLSFVARTGAKLADALAHAHSEGVLHCDVKPSNVLLTRDGEPLVLDFNLARALVEEAGRLGGTPPFMAPEQLLLAARRSPGGEGAAVVWHVDGEPRVDERTDVFGLAATLYDAVAGEPPFADGGPAVTRTLPDEFARRRRPIAWPALGGSDLARRLQRVIAAGLSFDPADRPATMAAFATALRDCLPTSRPVERREWSVRTWAMAASLLIAVPLSSWWLFAGHTPSSAASSTTGGDSGGPIPTPDVEAAAAFDPAAEFAAAVAAFGREEYDAALNRFDTLVMADASLLATHGVSRGPCVHAAIVSAVLVNRLRTLEPELRERLETPVGDEEEVLGPEVGRKFSAILSDLRQFDAARVQRTLARDVRPKFEADPSRSRAACTAVLYAIAAEAGASETARKGFLRDARVLLRRGLGLDRDK